MDSYRAALEHWCETEWGQAPEAISEWFVDEEIVQIFMRLKRSVLIADFIVEEDSSLKCKEHLQVPFKPFELRMVVFGSVTGTWKSILQLVFALQNGGKLCSKNG